MDRCAEPVVGEDGTEIGVIHPLTAGRWVPVPRFRPEPMDFAPAAREVAQARLREYVARQQAEGRWPRSASG